MKFTVKQGTPATEKTDALVVGLYEDEKTLPSALRPLDKALGGLIREALKTGEFRAKANESFLFPTQGKVPARRLLLVGLGKRDRMSLERIRQASGRTTRAIRDRNLSSFSTVLADVSVNHKTQAETTAAAVEGTLLGLYTFDRYKSNQGAKKSGIKTVTFLYARPQRRALEAAIQDTRVVAEAACLARDLVNTPSSDMTPAHLAKAARGIARTFRSVKVRVLGQRDLERLKMEALLAVGRGSEQSPKLIVLEYRGGRRSASGGNTAPICLVGKSVTFDTGGISIKPSARMDEMKYDMSGGAAVLGTMRAVARLKLPLHVVGILPAVENMPSGRAYKPGDILRAMNGKTIEVLNTDAEGRIILADGLAYASRYKPEAILDLATLTGACSIAVGNAAIAVMGTDDSLLERVQEAGEATGERVWPLPLWEEYEELIKSEVADIKNIGNRSAGVIVGGLFLKHFVGDTPWVHLDIASTAWSEKDQPYIPKGGAGVGVRLLVQLLKGWARIPRTKH